MGGTVVKPNVRKTRKIGEHVIGGFAGAAGRASLAFKGQATLTHGSDWPALDQLF